MPRPKRQAITPELKAAINNIAAKYGHLAEDVASHVTLEVLLHMIEDASFRKQRLGYQRQWCKWTAAKYYRELATYDNYVSGEDAVSALSLDGGEEILFDELVSKKEPTPEKMCIWQETLDAVQDALFQLPVTQERIARLLIDGHEPGEIARKMDMSPSHVSHTTKRMQTNMWRIAKAQNCSDAFGFVAA